MPEKRKPTELIKGKFYSTRKDFREVFEFLEKGWCPSGRSYTFRRLNGEKFKFGVDRSVPSYFYEASDTRLLGIRTGIL